VSVETESPVLVEGAAAGVPAAPVPEAEPGPWVSARPTRTVEIVRRVLRFPHVVHEHRDLVVTSLKRDLAARFQGTVLSWAWPFLQPLFLFGVYYFIFTELLAQRFPDLPDSQKAAMGVYMFSALVPWQALAESLVRGTSVIVDNGNLIKKLAFPSELLPLNVVLASTTTMLCGVAMFVLATLVTPVWSAPGLSVLWVPLLLVCQALFIYGLVLFLSTLHVFLRDTQQLVAMFTTVWMFLTPVFWAPQAIGEKIRTWMPVLSANPAYHMVQAWRGALMGDLVVQFQNGPAAVVSAADVPWHLAQLALWALVTYALGYAFFVLSQRRFADEV